MKNKIQRGFLPIYSKDIRRLIGYCDTWGYGNSETCRYIAETLIEDLYYKCKINDENNKEGIYQELISLAHNMNKGGCFYNIKFS
jgi:hypothetical protein